VTYAVDVGEVEAMAYADYCAAEYGPPDVDEQYADYWPDNDECDRMRDAEEDHHRRVGPVAGYVTIDGHWFARYWGIIRELADARRRAHAAWCALFARLLDLLAPDVESPVGNDDVADARPPPEPLVATPHATHAPPALSFGTSSERRSRRVAA
jgi:hypothetical protein